MALTADGHSIYDVFSASHQLMVAFSEAFSVWPKMNGG
jgi:hypothetical protein